MRSGAMVRLEQQRAGAQKTGHAAVASHQSEVKEVTGLARESLTGGSFELSPAVMFSAARPAGDNQPG